MEVILDMAFPFLSSEWMDAARAIRAKYQDQAPKITAVIRINQVITDVPFGDGTVKSYMDTSTGAMNDQAAAMQAFMGGKIKVAGDMMKMMALQTQMPQTDITAKVAEEIKAITE
ncbi:MAG: hypothetical protein EBT97_12235 [Actinobacteria bacterium]|nr:hypothetical protein [Actinomycetota bacterium]